MDSKRKISEKLIYRTLDFMDPSGLNSAKYKNIFSTMSDEDYIRWVENDSENVFLEVVPFKNEPNIKDINKAAEFLGVPLEEEVYMRHDGDTDNPVKLKHKVPVGYLQLKKMQQFLTKKNSFAISNEQRSMRFNQASGADSAAKITEPELYALTAIGADNILKELMGPRADADSKNEFYRKLSLDGFVSMTDLLDNVEGKRTLHVTSVYLTGMGINNDLIAPGYMLTLNKRKEDAENIKRTR